MRPPRTDPMALIRTADQWLRCAHRDTALDTADGTIGLAWQDEMSEEGAGSGPCAPPESAGLAFDPWCRIYHARPGEGAIETLLWPDRRRPGAARPLFDAPDAPGPAPGAFRPVAETAPGGPLHRPRGLAVDDGGRLFVAESAARRILVFDLQERRLLTAHRLHGRPEGLACDGRRVVAVVRSAAGTPGLCRMTATDGPEPIPLPEGVTDPGPLAFGPGGLWLIDGAGTPAARLLPLDRPGDAVDVPHATGLAAVDGILTVARAPGARFLRLRATGSALSQLPPLDALGYDGRGIAIDPDGRVAFWTAKGLGTATRARTRYLAEGRVVCFRLDSGAFQTRWGEIFVDACLPEGTDLRIRCLTADEPEEGAALPRTPPANIAAAEIHAPQLSPPMPGLGALELAPDPQTLFRRRTGSERPWHCAEPDFATYQAPVIAPPGRYLWLVLELTGRSRATPRVRGIRVTHPARDLLRRLPRVFSADAQAADFLHRYLTMADGDLDELDRLARLRHLLLSPDATPPGMLSWLGGLLGMEIDSRWPEDATRRILGNATALFRQRGTVAGLKRFVELYLGRDVVLIEHFKLRGLGGAFLGEAGAEAANSVLGAGFRVGGRIGAEAPDADAAEEIADAIAVHAHRFSLLVPALLDTERRDAIAHILDVHRPAHTVVDLCSVDSGMRAGIGLHLGLSSLVGATSGFGTLQVGGSALGLRDVVGRPGMATPVGGSHLGGEARVG